jgi:hypothetical protein
MTFIVASDFILKPFLSDINTAIPAFFGVPFAWKTFFHPLNLSHFCFSQ